MPFKSEWSGPVNAVPGIGKAGLPRGARIAAGKGGPDDHQRIYRRALCGLVLVVGRGFHGSVLRNEVEDKTP